MQYFNFKIIILIITLCTAGHASTGDKIDRITATIDSLGVDIPPDEFIVVEKNLPNYIETITFAPQQVQHVARLTDTMKHLVEISWGIGYLPSWSAFAPNLKLTAYLACSANNEDDYFITRVQAIEVNNLFNKLVAANKLSPEHIISFLLFWKKHSAPIQGSNIEHWVNAFSVEDLTDIPGQLFFSPAAVEILLALIDPSKTTEDLQLLFTVIQRSKIDMGNDEQFQRNIACLRRYPGFGITLKEMYQTIQEDPRVLLAEIDPEETVSVTTEPELEDASAEAPPPELDIVIAPAEKEWMYRLPQDLLHFLKDRSARPYVAPTDWVGNPLFKLTPVFWDTFNVALIRAFGGYKHEYLKKVVEEFEMLLTTGIVPATDEGIIKFMRFCRINFTSLIGGTMLFTAFDAGENYPAYEEVIKGSLGEETLITAYIAKAQEAVTAQNIIDLIEFADVMQAIKGLEDGLAVQQHATSHEARHSSRASSFPMGIPVATSDEYEAEVVEAFLQNIRLYYQAITNDPESLGLTSATAINFNRPEHKAYFQLAVGIFRDVVLTNQTFSFACLVFERLFNRFSVLTTAKVLEHNTNDVVKYLKFCLINLRNFQNDFDIVSIFPSFDQSFAYAKNEKKFMELVNAQGESALDYTDNQGQHIMKILETAENDLDETLYSISVAEGERVRHSAVSGSADGFLHPAEKNDIANDGDDEIKSGSH